ncbi:ATPase complex subunit [Wolffia australiana]
MQRLVASNGRRLGGAAWFTSAMWVSRGEPGLCKGPDLQSFGRDSSSSHPRLPQSLMPRRYFLDIYQVINKAAIQKERERLSDELNRGYFADIKEFGKHGGKIAVANKTIIPAMVAMRFPDLEAYFPDGEKLTLPLRSMEGEDNDSVTTYPCATLLCLSFRASSQVMTESWTQAFMSSFGASGNTAIYEVSLIDSWFLSLGPVRRLMLGVMKKSTSPGRQRVYSFGDHYDLRKKLKILNLLSGYIFLLDKFGRIRWQGFGSATEEELASLFACTSHLLEK